jgi:hypothetical protein
MKKLLLIRIRGVLFFFTVFNLSCKLAVRVLNLCFITLPLLMLFGFSFIWLQSPLMRHKLLKSAYGAIIQCLYVPKLLDRCHCWCTKPQILAFRRDKNLKDILVHKKQNTLFFKQGHKCEACSRNCAICPYVRNTHTFTNLKEKHLT